jgi:hypothetical protein
MTRWELWQTEDGDTAFFPEYNEQAREDARSDGLVFAWETTGRGHNDAMQLLYDHLGCGEYRPMLREDGTRYPGDEHDGR